MLPPGAPASSTFFGRMFPGLVPFAEATGTVLAVLLEVSAPGGIIDAAGDLAAGPKALIADPAVNGHPAPASPYGTNPGKPAMTAGSTFTDHDITFDQASQLGQQRHRRQCLRGRCAAGAACTVSVSCRGRRSLGWPRPWPGVAAPRPRPRPTMRLSCRAAGRPGAPARW